MLDIKFIRENPEAVKENIKKKFQDAKLPLVDQVIDLDARRRAAIAEADQLRSNRNALSKQIGMLMGQAKKDPSKLAEAEAVKAQVKEQADRLAELENRALLALYQLQQLYAAGDLDGCRETLAAIEAEDLAAALPEKAAEGVTTPADRYQQLRDAVEARTAADDAA